MGRAIVREADAFLFDEPLSNLDAKLRGQMRTEIARLQQKPRHHHRLRHPRPDRGDDAGRPGRRAQARRPAAARHPARALREPRQPLRRRVHRLTADELPARHRRGDDRQAPLRRGGAPGGEGPPGRGQGAADGRHPARALRGRVGEDRRAESARRSAPRSTSWSGWATRPTPTSPSRRRPRSRSSCASSSGTWTASRCTPSWWSPWTAPAGSARARRPRSGSTARRCTCSTRRTARTSPSTARTPGGSPSHAMEEAAEQPSAAGLSAAGCRFGSAVDPRRPPFVVEVSGSSPAPDDED